MTTLEVFGLKLAALVDPHLNYTSGGIVAPIYQSLQDERATQGWISKSWKYSQLYKYIFITTRFEFEKKYFKTQGRWDRFSYVWLYDTQNNINCGSKKICLPTRGPVYILIM